VRTGGGHDVIDLGSGRDRVDSGKGDDSIDSRDGYRDVVNCGRGTDTVKADPLDKLRGCEMREIARTKRAR
jgi:hypothetical protein